MLCCVVLCRGVDCGCAILCYVVLSSFVLHWFDGFVLYGTVLYGNAFDSMVSHWIELSRCVLVCILLHGIVLFVLD